LINDIQTPLNILKDEALLDRVETRHPKRDFIEDCLGQNRAGYKGEKRIRYYINLLNEHNLQVLHSIRLPGYNTAFQMDYLLITQKGLIILEVKYLSGTITVGDPLQQCIQTDENGKERRIKDPLTQVKQHRLQLIKWLQKHFPHQIPVDYLIVNTHPSGIIRVVDPKSEYVEKFFAEERFPHKFQELVSSYSQTVLSPNMIHQLVNLLKQKNTELDSTPLKRYNILPHEVLKGIMCPHCNKLSVKKGKKKWGCTLCGATSSDLPRQAIKDYFLIFNKPISNKECRDWLCIQSPDVVKRLLSNMDLKVIGKGKNTRYYPRDNSFLRA